MVFGDIFHCHWDSYCIVFLPPANEVWGKVMFYTRVSFCARGKGVSVWCHFLAGCWEISVLSVCWGVSVLSVCWESLFSGISVQGSLSREVSVRETSSPRQTPPCIVKSWRYACYCNTFLSLKLLLVSVVTFLSYFFIAIIDMCTVLVNLSKLLRFAFKDQSINLQLPLKPCSHRGNFGCQKVIPVWTLLFSTTIPISHSSIWRHQNNEHYTVAVAVWTSSKHFRFHEHILILVTQC